MDWKFKALSLALVPIFAIATLSAATASAEEWHAGAEGFIRGLNVGEEVITINAGTWKCKTSEYNGTVASTTSKVLVVKPTFKECTAFGFVNMTIDTGTCEYRFNTPVETTSTVDIINCGATPITVTAFNCWVTVGNQNELSHIVWDQSTGPPHHINATMTLEGITYTQHSKSFPGCTNGTFNNGRYTGTNTVRATNTAKEIVSLTVT